MTSLHLLALALACVFGALWIIATGGSTLGAGIISMLGTLLAAASEGARRRGR